MGVNVTGLAAGTYTGTVAINSSASPTQPAASITVNLTVLAVPKPLISQIQNAASSIAGGLAVTTFILALIRYKRRKDRGE